MTTTAPRLTAKRVRVLQDWLRTPRSTRDLIVHLGLDYSITLARLRRRGVELVSEWDGQGHVYTWAKPKRPSRRLERLQEELGLRPIPTALGGLRWR